MSKLKLKRSAREKDKASRRTDHPSMTSASGARSNLYSGVLIGALAGIGGTLFMLQGTWTADRMIVAQHIGQILGAACIGALFGYFVARALQAR
jgi:F0F1-type ATP synthase assembly protein I